MRADEPLVVVQCEDIHPALQILCGNDVITGDNALLPQFPAADVHETHCGFRQAVVSQCGLLVYGVGEDGKGSLRLYDRPIAGQYNARITDGLIVEAIVGVVGH